MMVAECLRHMNSFRLVNSRWCISHENNRCSLLNFTILFLVKSAKLFREEYRDLINEIKMYLKTTFEWKMKDYLLFQRKLYSAWNWNNLEMLIAWNGRGAFHLPAFMSSCLTISHTCLPPVLSERTLVFWRDLFVVGQEMSWEMWESSELGRWERCISGVRWQCRKCGRIVRWHGQRGGLKLLSKNQTHIERIIRKKCNKTTWKQKSKEQNEVIMEHTKINKEVRGNDYKWLIWDRFFSHIIKISYVCERTNKAQMFW